MSLIDLVYSSAWAIRPEALAAILSLVEREDIPPEVIAAAMHYDPDAQAAAKYAHQLRIPFQSVAQKSGTPVDGAPGLTRRGPTAVLDITGPIVRRASMFSSMSGSGASTESLSRDLTRAVDDPSFTSILLNIDSPGGEASGIAELADMIVAARDRKPTWAYVSDLGASAGYWLASAASEIVIAKTGAVGSIGVVAAYRNPHATKRTDVEFVSSVSPHKRPDPTTQAGAAQIQGMVDALGDIFVNAVAENRGVDTATVLSDFGAGGLLIGQDAVRLGMADRLGSFEGTLTELAQRRHDQSDEEHDEKRRKSTKPPFPRDRKAAATPPVPVDATGHDSPAARVLAGDASALRRHPAGRSVMSSFRDQLMNFLMNTPDGSPGIDGSADQEASIVTNHLREIEPTAPQAIAGVVLSTDEAPIPPAFQARLAELEAQNATLKLERIHERAQVFAREQLTALRASAPQEAGIVALFSQLAADDERFGGVTLSDGSKGLRTTLLGNYFATVQSRKDLTAELLDPAVHRAIADRAESVKRDEAATPTQERVNTLLAMTPMGRDALDARTPAPVHTNGAR